MKGMGVGHHEELLFWCHRLRLEGGRGLGLGGGTGTGRWFTYLASGARRSREARRERWRADSAAKDCCWRRAATSAWASAMKDWLQERVEPSLNLWQVNSLVRSWRSLSACWLRARAACWEMSRRRKAFSFSRSLILASSCSFLLNDFGLCAVLMASFGLLFLSVMVGSF